MTDEAAILLEKDRRIHLQSLGFAVLKDSVPLLWKDSVYKER